MKKKIITIFLGVFLILLLTGASCSKKPANSNTSQQNPTYFPYINKTQPVNPSAAPYQKPTNNSTNTQDLSSEDLLRQAKIGRINYIKYPKFGLSGAAQIISPSLIHIQNYFYGGGCQTHLVFYLTISTDPLRVLADVTPPGASDINTTPGGRSFDLKIPTNLDLLNFDSLAISCYGYPEPLTLIGF